MQRVLFSFLAVLVLAACGDVSDGVIRCSNDTECPGTFRCRSGYCTSVTGSETRADAGRMGTVDAGLMPPFFDAGVELQSTVDAGAPVDAGVAIDAGAEPDAGAERDAGAMTDGGIVSDAGASDAGPVDSGVPDAGPICIPTRETCNGRDDDCDGEADEALVFTGDAGTFVLDGGTVSDSGACTVGVGACLATGWLQCSSGQVVCSVSAGLPSAEICNGVDDDCDGVSDEVGPGLCATGGAVCSAGTCACPSGQEACGGTCQVTGASCSAGFGECLRRGTTRCADGVVTCNAIAGSPSPEVCNDRDDDCDNQIDEISTTLCPVNGQLCGAGVCACPSGQIVCKGSCFTATAEVCDGVDNDCNGQTDEGTQVVCHPDSDRDAYRDSTSSSVVCPAPGTTNQCPLGYVALGTGEVDCAAGDASRFRRISSINDNDRDLACSGTPADDCVGSGPLPGRQFVRDCASMTDCDDSRSDRSQLISQRLDADGDGHCTGPVETVCANAISSGRRAANSCLAIDDCSDSDSRAYYLTSTRSDADNDGYCAGSPQDRCVGDSYVPAGFRRTNLCSATTDCNDSKSVAGPTCTLIDAYETSSRGQGCPSGATTNSLVVTKFCPAGWTVGSYRAQVISGGGTCTAVSATSIQQSCQGLEGTTCRVVGHCVPW